MTKEATKTTTERDRKLAKLADYVNSWAGILDHPEARDGIRTTEFGKGYQAACRDINDKLKELGLR